MPIPPATAHDLTIDHGVTDVFEPGSVFKVVTIGGALSQHDITPNTAFRVPGSLQVADRVIHDAEPHGLETLKVKQILQRSSNIGTDLIAERYLGESGLRKWMARFGFGRRTGIDYPGESRGLLPSYWSGSTIGTVPIGQGVSVTGIQLASAYAAIANGGEWIQPHLVDHVAGRASGETEETAHPRARRRLPAAHDVARASSRIRGRPSSPPFPATPSPARRGRHRSRGRTATSPARTSRPSSGWCRPRARACSCS